MFLRLPFCFMIHEYLLSDLKKKQVSYHAAALGVQNSDFSCMVVVIFLPLWCTT